MSKYYEKRINEGFDVIGTRLKINPRHDLILNTGLSGKPVRFIMHSNALDMDIEVYSIFKRMQLTKEEREIVGLKPKQSGDANPVIYALKKENGWTFDKDDEKQFWKIFEYLLRVWLREHKGEYDTTVLVPSSRRINRNMLEMIKKISKEVGITSFVNKGLMKMTTTQVADMAANEKSFFYHYWSEIGLFDEAYDRLSVCLDRMDEENNGIFKYHFIEDIALRTSVIDTLYWADEYKEKYIKDINDKNILIVDDSITHGQTIESTINAISNVYEPKSVSVITMFSRLYGPDGNEITKKEELPDWILNR